MRQLTLQIPDGYGKQALRIFEQCNSENAALSTALGTEGEVETITALVPNQKVETFLEHVERDLPEASISFSPSAKISLSLPSNEIPQSLLDTKLRSSLEVFLAGVQSIGSWPSFSIYAAIAGIIVWIGLYTNSVFLLVASMLIAPFGGPAMNVAIASARGDLNLLKRSLARYFSALAIVVFITWLLSMVFGQTIATSQMVSVSEVSATAALLPLVGGVAGALQLVQSERSSLVSGTAIGMLVAAALAPPAGIIGMSIAIGRPEMIVSGVFLLLLQLAGINISCTLVFRFYGLNSQGAIYQRGQRTIFPIALALSALTLALLLSWQFSTSPMLLRSSRTQTATAIVHSVVNNNPYVSLVESDVRFTRANIDGQNTLLSNLYVQPKQGQDVSLETVDRRLKKDIQTALEANEFEVTPLVNITLLEPLP